jgi:hypothetical protein
VNRLFYIWLLIVIWLPIQAQVITRPQIDVESLINKLAPISTEDLNYEEIYENLYSILQNPLDINRAERADLSALFFLSERQINEILEHRKRFGRFLSLYELQSLESFSVEDIRNLLPFIVLQEDFGDLRVKSLLKRATEHYLVIRADQTLEEARGFKEGLFAGPRQRIYTRYRLSRSKDFSVGFISERDPGEKNFFDYTVFHIQLQNKGNFKNIVVGDYLLQFGQGLIFSAGYVAGKGGEPVYTTRRSNLGARPYNSLIENGSFKGATTTYKAGRFEVTGMFSYKRKDASIGEPTETADEYFSSLLTAGLHRTETEIKNRNALLEQNIGGNILYKVDHIQLGFSVLNTRFDKDFVKRDLPYNFYDFTGKANTIAGPNISISWNNFNIFGEAARSSSGGFGYLIGVVGSLGQKVEWAFNHRNYQPDFHTLYGNGFSEGSRTINEKGVYSGLKYSIKKGLEVVGYYDVFSFPWLRYRVDAPSSGHDYQLRINYKPNKKFSTYLAYRGESKERNPSGSTAVLRQPIATERRGVVWNGDYAMSMFLKLQSKVQYNGFGVGESKWSNGWAFMQDVEVKVKRMQFKTRVAYFNTDTYDSRIYAYENDVLYAVSFPAYNGQGFRYYFLTKLPLGNRLEAWIRLSQTRLNNQESVGSGYNLIEGNTRTDAKLQLKYKL